MTIGGTIGKFTNLHKGHLNMFTTALCVVDELYIMVSGNETDVVPLSTRHKWLCELFADNHNVHIVKHIDNIPSGEVDEDGTITDSAVWAAWKTEFELHLPKLDYFVSSDMYGKKAAEVLGCRWLPIDPKRTMNTISSTAIRESMLENWSFLSKPAQRHFHKRVAVVGPESTGKSVLVNSFGLQNIGTPIPEYGRIITQVKDEVDEKDFEAIVKIQDKWVNDHAYKAEMPVTVSDTEAFTTYLFSYLYLDKPMKMALDYAQQQHFDLYIVLAPTVKWVQDGTRVVEGQKLREWFFEEMCNFINDNDCNYVVISDTDFDERTKQAHAAVRKLFESDE